MTARSKAIASILSLTLVGCAGSGGGGSAPGVRPARLGWTQAEHDAGLLLNGVSRGELYLYLALKKRDPGFELWVQDFDRHLDLRCEKKCEVLEHNTLKQENVK